MNSEEKANDVTNDKKMRLEEMLLLCEEREKSEEEEERDDRQDRLWLLLSKAKGRTQRFSRSSFEHLLLLFEEKRFRFFLFLKNFVFSRFSLSVFPSFLIEWKQSSTSKKFVHGCLIQSTSFSLQSSQLGSSLFQHTHTHFWLELNELVEDLFYVYFALLLSWSDTSFEYFCLFR